MFNSAAKETQLGPFKKSGEIWYTRGVKSFHSLCGLKKVYIGTNFLYTYV